MSLFKKKKHESPFYEEDSLDTQFDNIMSWVRDLARKDYNKLKKAMDKAYDGYQILHGIEPVDDSDKADEFVIYEGEGK